MKIENLLLSGFGKFPGSVFILFVLTILSSGNLLHGGLGPHTLFIKEDGSLWGMGRNNFGQLGNGDTTALNTPQRLIEANSTNPIIQVSSGQSHSLFIRKDGSLWAMGGNHSGQLGDGTVSSRSTPVCIEVSGVVRCSAGYSHSMYIKEDGSLWGMGSNLSGELGINLAGGVADSFDEGVDLNSSVQVIPSGVSQVTCGWYFTLFVKMDGSLWGMGEVHNVRLAKTWAGGITDNYDENYDHKIPVRILSTGVVQAAAGAQFALILKSDGSAWSFGDNWEGQLADGNTSTSRHVPYRLLDENVSQLSAGWPFGGALMNDGSLHMFGGNRKGQLGDGTTTDRNRTTEILSSGVAQLATGGSHSIILKEDGSLWTFGSGEFGQLGNGYSGGGSDFDVGIDLNSPFQAVSSGVRILPDTYYKTKPNLTSDLNSSVSVEKIWVEPGTVTMGSPTNEVGRDANETEHNVTLTKGFYLGKHEVTQAQYEAVMKGNSEGLNAKPSYWPNFPNQPVENITWHEIQVFLKRLNSAEREAGRLPTGWLYVLPTESQWEYACRAGTTTIYPWGNDINASLANFNGAIGKTTDVGQYPSNPWGFFDMQGNVWEWTADWFGAYPSGNPVIDPIGASSGTVRTVRGGSRLDNGHGLRSANRGVYNPAGRISNLGFRLALRQVYDFHGSNPLISALSMNPKTGALNVELTIQQEIELVFRVLGQSLGVPGASADTHFSVLDNTYSQVASNDDWGDGAQSSLIQDMGLAPIDSTESAHVITLAPGTYSLEAMDVDGDESSVKLEVFSTDQAVFDKIGSVKVYASYRAGAGIRFIDFTQDDLNTTLFFDATDETYIPPSFTDSNLSFMEGIPPGTAIINFDCYGESGGFNKDTVAFSLVSGENNNSLFSLETNGTLKTNAPFDYDDNQTSFLLQIQAKDDQNNTIEGNFTIQLLTDLNGLQFDVSFRSVLEYRHGKVHFCVLT